MTSKQFSFQQFPCTVFGKPSGISGDLPDAPQSSFMRPFRILTLLVAVFLLGGCQLELAPFATATVSRFVSGQPTKTANLSPEQVSSLASWFAEHPSGWSHSVVGYVPALEVRLKHAGGETSVVNVMPSKVVIYNRSGQLEQNFSVSSIAGLLAVIGG